MLTFCLFAVALLPLPLSSPFLLPSQPPLPRTYLRLPHLRCSLDFDSESAPPSPFADAPPPPSMEFTLSYTSSPPSTCLEVPTPASATALAEADEVDLAYSTSLRTFSFPDAGRTDTAPSVTVRQTSYSCGQLGSSVWSSAIALASHLKARPDLVECKRVLELGAGCGLPGLVARMGGAKEVVMTDFWREEDDEYGHDMPSEMFGGNLQVSKG